MSDLEAQLQQLDLAIDEDYFKNMDDLVNCKIVMGMKKAIQLIFNKVDLICEQKMKALVAAEIDAKLKELKEVAREQLN